MNAELETTDAEETAVDESAETEDLDDDIEGYEDEDEEESEVGVDEEDEDA